MHITRLVGVFSKLPFRWDLYGLAPYKGWLLQYVNLLSLRSNIVSDRFPRLHLGFSNLESFLLNTGGIYALRIQSPSENGNGTYILCVSEVIRHPNHPPTFGDWIVRVYIYIILWHGCICLSFPRHLPVFQDL